MELRDVVSEADPERIKDMLDMNAKSSELIKKKEGKDYKIKSSGFNIENHLTAN